jgi:phosphate transport system permease protein
MNEDECGGGNVKFHEKLIEIILFLCALTAIFGLVLITYFIFREGVPIMFKYGIKKFLLGTTWAPLRYEYGIFPMIIGTILTTLGALILGVPIGVGCAVYLAEIANEKFAKIVKPAIELLAGIPSVIYGLYGLTVIVPFIKKVFNNQGFSILAGSIILAIMILPTIVNISESAIKAVPSTYKEGSLGLGSSHWQAIYRVIVPSAKSGITASVVLGMSRAIGETMAIIMVLGNTAIIPQSILSPARTLTGNIGIEMGYASAEHQKALFATGVVLFIFIMILNIIANMIYNRAGENK